MKIYLLTFILFSPSLTFAELSFPSPYIKNLYQTKAINIKEIYNQLQLEKLNTGENNLSGLIRFGNATQFSTKNPYQPVYKTPNKKYYAQKRVIKWFENLINDSSVCALKFIDSNKRRYSLRTFRNKQLALKAGFKVTHQYKCGTCSTLKDLAVYMAKPDLTEPAKTCTKKLTLNKMKKCYEEKIGFSPLCAEMWSYNSKNTKKRCAITCMKHYGLFNVLANNMNSENTDSTGKLNPCIACDENKSGPGFKYGAGRTRRASVLLSAINRSSDEIYEVDHSNYFQ